MKFGMVCDVEGKTYLENGTTIEADGIRYIFYVNDDFLLTQFRIIADVDDPEKYFYYSSSVTSDGSFTVQQGFEEHIKVKLLKEAQRIESSLALIGNIKRIRWDKAVFEYYPETTEEHAQFNIIPTWFYMREMKTDDPQMVPMPYLEILVKDQERFQPFIAPMAFLREAKADYTGSNYISAFFNSYFILEGLFGNGKWKSDVIINEFMNSPILTESAHKILDEAGKNNDPGKGIAKAQIEYELKSKGQDFTVRGLLKVIIKKRGDLHHFSMKSTKAQGTPFNRLDYKLISLITMVVASNALRYFLFEQDKVKNA
jgi:hypothetical protein